MFNPKDNIKDCIMTAVHRRLSLWMPKFIECRYDLKQFPYEKLLIQANQMHLSFKNICFNHLIPCMHGLKKWVKLFDFYGILWYFEKGLMGSLWLDLGHSWFFCEKYSLSPLKW